MTSKHPWGWEKCLIIHLQQENILIIIVFAALCLLLIVILLVCLIFSLTGLSQKSFFFICGKLGESPNKNKKRRKKEKENFQITFGWRTHCIHFVLNIILLKGPLSWKIDGIWSISVAKCLMGWWLLKFENSLRLQVCTFFKPFTRKDLKLSSDSFTA